MTTARQSDLLYGHLGSVAYDGESQEWHFQRLPGISRRLQVIGEPSTALESTLLQPQLRETQLAGDRRKHIDQLINADPLLTPASSLLPSLTQVSEAVDDSTSTFEPLKSILLAFGRASNQGILAQDDNTATVDILAVASGPTGEAVRLIRLQNDQRRWEDSKNISLLGQILDYTEQTCWVSNGGAVQQVCFSLEDGKPGKWLAIRHSGATTICQPLLRRAPVSFKSYKKTYENLKHGVPSRLDANPMLDLLVERTGGAPHVDVAFNPWNQSQFAVLDVVGHWTTWEIETGPDLKTSRTLIAGPSGDLGSSGENNLEATPEDGWGVILWVYDEKMLVVSNRCVLVIYVLQEIPMRIPVPDLGLTDGADWILDVRQSPNDLGHFFILTSLRVFWLQVQRRERVTTTSDSPLEVQILLSWRHFRSQDDVSIKILLKGLGDETTVLIYGHMSELVTGFTFGFLASSKVPSSVSDPFLFNLSDVQDDRQPRADIPLAVNQRMTVRSLELQPLKYVVSSGAGSIGLGQVYLDSGITFLRLYVLYSDLALRQQLCAHTEIGTQLPPQPITRVKGVRKFKTLTKVVEDSFIVPDGTLLDEEESIRRVSNTEGVLSRFVDKTHHETSLWTINFEWLIEGFKDYQSVSSEGPQYVESSEEILRIMLDEMKVGKFGVRILSELVPELRMKDLTQLSGNFQEVLNTIHEGIFSDELDGIQTLFLLTPSMSSLIQGKENDLDDLTLTAVYENLLNQCISPLAKEVPSKTRIGRERDLRKVVAELYKASHGIQIRSFPHQNAASFTSVNVNNDLMVLPLRRKTSNSSQSSKGKGKLRDSSPLRNEEHSSNKAFDSSQRSFPMPDPTTSLHSSRSDSLGERAEYSAYERLKSLTAIGFQPPLSRQMTRLLDHWTLGEDPEKYDWERAQQMDQSDKEGIDEQPLKHRKKRAKPTIPPSQPESSQNLLPMSSPSLYKAPMVSEINQSQIPRIVVASSQAIEPQTPSIQVPFRSSQNISQPGSKVKPKRAPGFR